MPPTSRQHLNHQTMSRFDYKNNVVTKRVETVEVTTNDFLDILTNNDLSRVQKVTAIRTAVRDSYIAGGYKEVAVRFVDGVIDDLVEHSKLEGRPLPSKFLFDVELHMPVVEASKAPVYYKDRTDYKQSQRDSTPPTFRDNDHVYWE